MNGDEQKKAEQLPKILEELNVIRCGRANDRLLLEAIFDQQTKIVEKIESILTESAEAQEEPAVEEPAVEEPAVEEPESDGSGVEQPAVEEPAGTSQEPESHGSGIVS